MSIVLTNFQNTTLAAASASGSTSFTLSSSANLPTLTAGQIMPLVLNDAATGAILEVVYVTAISGAVLTVTRAQEGTTAQNWNIGDFAYCAPTAQTLATINGSSSQVFNAANATAGTQEVVPISQADIRYAPINGSSSQVFNVANATTSTEAVALGQLRSTVFGQGGQSFCSTSYTLVPVNAGQIVSYIGSAAGSITLPAANAGAAGTLPIIVYNASSYPLSIVPPSGDTLSANQSVILNAGQTASFWNDGTSTWIVVTNSGGTSGVPFVVGNAVAANQAVALGQVLGIGQSWQTVSRVSGTTYTNSTNKAIVLTVMTATNVQSYSLSISVSGVVVASISENFTGAINQGCVSAIIPAGATYGFTASGSPGTVVTVELR